MGRYGDIVCAINRMRTAHGSIELHPTIYFPCAMALRLMPRSPRRRIRLVTVACGLMARLGPVEPGVPPRTWRQQRASGPRGFAVRSNPSSPRGFAGFWRRSSCAPSLAHGNRPANKLRADAAASTTSHPAFVTIAIRPCCRDRTGRAGSADLPDALSEIFWREGLDDPNRLEIA